jgi:hypothetical protein
MVPLRRTCPFSRIPRLPTPTEEAITAEAVVKQINEMLADSPPSASVGEDGDSTSGNITIIRNEFFRKTFSHLEQIRIRKAFPHFLHFGDFKGYN